VTRLWGICIYEDALPVLVYGCRDLGAQRRRKKEATAGDQHCNWDAVFHHVICLPRFHAA
jgi:hypothetical protein